MERRNGQSKSHQRWESSGVYGKIEEAEEATSYAPKATRVVSQHVVEGNNIGVAYIYIYIYIGFININMYISYLVINMRYYTSYSNMGAHARIYIYIYPNVYSCVIRVYNCSV
jgi:hypothetical protein